MDSKSDIRGLLQYVPLFRGKVFVIDVDWSSATEAAKAEVMMDLAALQSVGVKLVVSLCEAEVQHFFDYSAEIELRVSADVRSVEDNNLAALLDRGQAFVVRRDGDLVSDSLIDLCAGLGGSKLICLTVNPYLLDGDGEVIKFIHVSDFAENVSEFSEGGDLQIQAVKACDSGVPRVHLLDVCRQGVLLSELFSQEGVGTMFYTDSYRAIRQIGEEDISEMLGMIGRSVRNTHLVPRTFEEVRDHIEAYYVMEVDDNVVGCIALYEYGACAEVACLYVKQSHEGTGYGASMVSFVEGRAKEKGIGRVFALSDRAAVFFERLGYAEMCLEDLPAERLERLRESGRSSRAFSKMVI